MRPFAWSWSAVLLLGGALLFDRGLGGGEAGDRDAVGRAAHVGETDLVAEFHGVGVAAVFAADAELEARAGGAAMTAAIEFSRTDQPPRHDSGD